MFFLLVFFVALMNFFQMDQKLFFISSPSLTFLEICPMFFYFVTLINITKNRFNGFFLKCSFLPALDFGSKTDKLNIVALAGRQS